LIVRRRIHEIRRYFFEVAVHISRFYTSDDRFREVYVEGTRVVG
jgi:hypothetical protein